MSATKYGQQHLNRRKTTPVGPKISRGIPFFEKTRSSSVLGETAAYAGAVKSWRGSYRVLSRLSSTAYLLGDSADFKQYKRHV